MKSTVKYLGLARNLHDVGDKLWIKLIEIQASFPLESPYCILFAFNFLSIAYISSSQSTLLIPLLYNKSVFVRSGPLGFWFSVTRAARRHNDKAK